MKNRRLIIGVCIVVVLLIPALLWGFVSYHSLPVIQRSKENTSKKDFIPYQGNNYTLYYPKGWQKDTAPIANGTGNEFYLHPATANPSVVPHVIVDVMDSRLTTVSKVVNPYVLFRYQKSTATVAGVGAQKYSTVVTTNEGTLHSIVYIFEANDTIYLFKLGYKQVATDPQLENEFVQMINAFSLK